MYRYGAPLFLVFLLSSGCAVRYPDNIWAPKSVPEMFSSGYAMRNIASKCNDGFYTGFSAKNLDQRMSQRCEHLDGGNIICAVRGLDDRSRYELRPVYDSSTKKTEYKYEYIPENDRYVINLYINDKGIVYDCKAGEGHAALIYKSEPEKGSIAASLPAN